MLKWSHLRRDLFHPSSLLLVGIVAVLYFMFSVWMASVGSGLAVLVWGVLKELKSVKLKFSEHWYWGGVFLCFFVLILSHWYPFSLSSAPLGFDTGLYRYEFMRSIQALPGYVSQLFVGFPLVTNVFALSGFGVDFLLKEFYVGLVLLLGGIVYVVSREEHGKEAALLALFLFSTSLVQWKLFEMVLFKQLLALSFILYSLMLLSKRSYWSVLPLGFLVLLQPLDVFLVGVAFVLWSVFQIRNDESRRFLGVLSGVGVLGIALVLWMNPDFWHHAWMILKSGFMDASQLEFSLKEGVFLKLDEYGMMAMPVLVLGLIGVCRSFVQKKCSIYSSYAILVLLWVLAGLFFYKRLLIQLDLVMILFAGAVVWDLFSLMRSRIMKGVFVALIVLMSVPFFQRVSDYRPVVSEQEFQDIVSFCENLDEGQYVMASDGRYGPWLRGYCLDQRVIAPGQFEHDKWTEDEWITFWRDPYQQSRDLFSRFDDVVYVFVGDNQQRLDLPRIIFRQVGERWYEVE